MRSWTRDRSSALRHIHQLALTYMLYPAATHKRFEHSLGVMELAGRVFDIVTKGALNNKLPKLVLTDDGRLDDISEDAEHTSRRMDS